MQWQTIELVNQLTPAPPNRGTWIRTDRAQVIGGWLVRTVLVKREIVQLSAESTTQLVVNTVPNSALV